MKLYGIYNIVVKDGESLRDRFDEIVQSTKGELSKILYSTKEDAYNNRRIGETSREVWQIIYEIDYSREFPWSYRLVGKDEINIKDNQ